MSELEKIADPTTLSQIFASLQAGVTAEPNPDRAARRDRLDRLQAALQSYGDRLIAAMSADFSYRSEMDSRLLDLNPSLGEIRFARRKLRGWMQARPVSMPLQLLPARGRIMPQPLGVVGIIAPWNFPLFLAIPPLATALAAGNRVMLKPSELAPRSADLLSEMIAETFAPEEVAVVTGGPEVAAEFAALPFDHLLFTGSTEVGRKVALAAAANLTPVTLELGGKSPAILTASGDLDRAARRIAWGKAANAGQICVAPDYALVPRDRMAAFADAVMAAWQHSFPDGLASRDLSAVISERHLARLQGMVDQARAAGCEVRQLDGTAPEGLRRFAPTLVIDPPADLQLMQQEIFGPILPLIPYDDPAEALQMVGQRDHPLALYVFAEDPAERDFWLQQSISGGACVNEVVVHVGCDSLPFGGVGASGQGAYHGDRGFETFSHMKSVLLQPRLNAMGMVTPPYGAAKRRLVRVLGKFV